MARMTIEQRIRQLTGGKLGDANARATARARADRYTAEIAQIRADPELTEAGKRRRIGEAYMQQKKALDELGSIERAQIADRRTELDRQLFGGHASGADAVMLARDAAARAAACENVSDARKLLQQALRTGDTGLAQAVARWGHDVGHHELVTEYAKSDPGLADALNELRRIDGAGVSAADRARAITERIAREATYHVGRPVEVADTSDAALQAEIAEAAQEHQPDTPTVVGL